MVDPYQADECLEIIVTAPPLPLSASDRDYLRMMYEEHAEHARQHETLRATATTLMVALIGAILAFGIGQKQPDWQPQMWAGVIVCASSALGIVLNHKHHEKAELHKGLLTRYREAIESEVQLPLSNIQEAARRTHRERYWFTAVCVRLWMLWIFIYAATFVAGAVMIGLAVKGYMPPCPGSVLSASR